VKENLPKSTEPGPPGPAPSRPRRRLLPKVLAILVCLLIALVFFEALCAGYYLIKDRKYIPVRERMLAERNSYLEQVVPKHAAYVDLLFPHPYLAYVYNPDYPNPNMPANRDGFLGQPFPLAKQPGVFVLLVTGGSAANQLAGLTQDLNVLEQRLNRFYTNDTVRKFIVLNGAAGAWHQPQQLIMFELYAHVIDGVINMDGFNEKLNLESVYRLEKPPENYLGAMTRQLGGSSILWNLWLDGKILRLQRDIWPFNRSFSFYMTASNIRRVLRNLNRNRPDNPTNKSVKNTISRLFTPPKDWSREKKNDDSLRHYQNYLRMMHGAAQAMKIKDLYLIQPAPALNKELTTDELKVVGDLSYRDLYQQMADRLLELKQDGVPVYSLLNVFKDEKGTIYEDIVHVTHQGNEIMADRICQLLESEWQLRPSNAVSNGPRR
jgi:hypothetical protein